MKLLRIPAIRCRADEIGAVPCEMEWRGNAFQVLAYSETEARSWWRDLPDAMKRDMLGNGAPAPGLEEAALF